MVYIALGAAVLLIAADQLLKYLVLEGLTKVVTLPLIQDVLHLTYVENRGAAFGIFQGQRWLLIGVTSAVLLGITVYLLMGKIKDKIPVWGTALILAGGAGNLIDRATRGFVVDYVDFRLINFYVFNLADACVCVGVGLVILYLLILEPLALKRKKHSDEAAPDGGNSEQV